MGNGLVKCAVAALAITAGARIAGAEGSRVSVGIRGGLNLASFHGDDAGGGNLVPKNRTGFSGGVFVGIRLTQNFLIQPEVLYSQKGVKYWISGVGEGFTVKVDYVEIPVLLKACFGSGGVKPSVFAGPAVAFKVRAKIVIEDEEESAEDFRGTDFGGVFGAGLDVAVGSGSFTIDGRYTLGLRTLDNFSVGIKNGVWSFSVGYTF